jgi:hypothetical protein
MRSGREAWRSGSAAVIKAATGCLRHTLARTAERRAVQQPDYPAAAGDLQELASRSALVSHVAQHFDRRDPLTVKSHARCLFLARLGHAYGLRQCPLIGDRRNG